MSASNRGLARDIFLSIRQLVLYNWNDLKKLLLMFGAITGGTAALALVWAIGYPDGVTQNVLRIVDDALPGQSGPAFVAPIGFLIGLLSISLFDPYKRVQGFLIFLPSVVMIFLAGRFANRIFNHPLTPELIIGFSVAALFGWVIGGGYKIWTEARPKMEEGFRRLTFWFVLPVGLLGIFEAGFDYRSPILHAPNDPIEILDYSIPASVGSPSILQSPTSLELIGMVLVMAVLFGLMIALLEFTQYKKGKDVLLLGPDRAGKTWLMSGAAFSLNNRAVSDLSFEDPNLNPSLDAYFDIFQDRDFDNDNLKSNAQGEFDFFSFSYEHGIVPKQLVQARTVDYAGEHLSNVNIVRPWKVFNDQWVGDDDKEDALDKEDSVADKISPDEVPDFNTLEYLNQIGRNDPGQKRVLGGDDLPPLLSAMVADSDAIGLILPADEFATNISEFPNHIDSDTVTTRRRARRTRERYYFKLYKKLLDNAENTDFFFVVTMSDIFLETFKNDPEHKHVDPKGHPNWERFREHIYEQIVDYNEQPGNFADFLKKDSAKDYRKYYPVYFQAEDPPNHTTAQGEYRPYLDWDDDYYPLRGLKHLLRRMGR